MVSHPFSRRTLLRSLPFLTLGARALGFGDGARFVPAVAQHGGRWDGRMSGMRRLAWEIQRRSTPLGVRLHHNGFVSESAAKLAGEKALKYLLDGLAGEEATD